MDRHGALRRDKARQVWIGSGRYGGAMQGPDRFGKARPGKAGQVGSGKTRRVAFFWDLVRQGRCVGACWVQA